MKTKLLLLITILALSGCTKEEPTTDEYGWDCPCVEFRAPTQTTTYSVLLRECSGIAMNGKKNKFDDKTFLDLSHRAAVQFSKEQGCRS